MLSENHIPLNLIKIFESLSGFLSTENTLYSEEFMILPWVLTSKHINPGIREWYSNPNLFPFDYVVLFLFCFVLCCAALLLLFSFSPHKLGFKKLLRFEAK